MKPYYKGYKTAMSDAKLQQFKELFHQKSLVLGLFYTIITLFSILIAIIIISFLSKHIDNIFLLVGLIFVLIVFITRQLRALENIVHFGSHVNFTKKRKLNDFLINYLVAFPILQTVEGYREFHNKHHGSFGGANDLCKIRFDHFNNSTSGIANVFEIYYILQAHIVPYIIGFYKVVGSKLSTLLRFITWHLVLGGGIWYLFGYNTFLIYLGVIVFCMFITLPVIRFVGELSEHDYNSSDSEFYCTFNNLSAVDLLLFHPAGDAYHLLYHLYPVVPWWLQLKAHKYLDEHDINYRLALHRTNFMQCIACNK